MHERYTDDEIAQQIAYRAEYCLMKDWIPLESTFDYSMVRDLEEIGFEIGEKIDECRLQCSYPPSWTAEPSPNGPFTIWLRDGRGNLRGRMVCNKHSSNYRLWLHTRYVALCSAFDDSGAEMSASELGVPMRACVRDQQAGRIIYVGKESRTSADIEEHLDDIRYLTRLAERWLNRNRNSWRSAAAHWDDT